MSRARALVRHVVALGVAAAAMTACAEPPTREINQAQGALDAARAAGAETYARTEFQAADTALRRAHEAVGERDYRQALSFALDARERARAAARDASETRARAATEIAQRIQTAARTLETARTRLTGPAASRETRARFEPVLEALAIQLQEARSALAAGDYGRAGERTHALEDGVAGLPAARPR
jgi:hypothetical protein